MLENARPNSSIDQIELGFVEREAAPEFLMKLSIQLHLSGLLLSNTVRVLEIFDVHRAATPDDTAILLRRRTHLDRYLRALEEYNMYDIPICRRALE